MERLSAAGPPAHADGTGAPITKSHYVSLRNHFPVAQDLKVSGQTMKLWGNNGDYLHNLQAGIN